MENKTNIDNEKDKNMFFDSNNPTKENIEYCFSELLLNLYTVIDHKDFFDVKKDYEDILKLVKKWLSIYLMERSLININHEELLDVYYDTEELIQKCIFKKEDYYAHRVAGWHWNLMVLRKAQIDMLVNNDE